MTARVVMFSGGISSWATARRVAEAHGTEELVLLFADTGIEHPSTYRFVYEGAIDAGGRLEVVADGRDPWQVFRDERFIGNTRADVCSKILKRELLRRWLSENCQPAETVVYLGMDWDEGHRIERTRGRWAPWEVAFPMAEEPLRFKDDLIAEAEARGLTVPILYKLGGFAHANCSGFCIKAGHGQFKRLLETLPDVYAHHEAEEEETRAFLGKDVAILRERSHPRILERLGLTPEDVEINWRPWDEARDGPYDETAGSVRPDGYRVKATGERVPTTLPMTLRAFRERVEADDLGQLNLLDGSACSCIG